MNRKNKKKKKNTKTKKQKDFTALFEGLLVVLSLNVIWFY